MNDRQTSRLFWGAKVLLIAVLLYAAIAAIWTPSAPAPRLKPRAVSGDERPIGQIKALPQARQNTDYSVLVDSNIFGATSPSPRPESPSMRSNAESLRSAEALGLRLVGVVAGGPTTSRAIIEDTNTRITGPYKIGDVVASATVATIESDRVFLTHNGQTKVLHLHTAQTPRSPSQPIATGAAEGTPSPSLATVKPPAPPSGRLGYVEDLFRTATIEPYVKNGRTEGLKITGLDQSPLAALVGLRDGDIVQTVNGQDLDSKQKAFQILKKARTQSKIDIHVLRNGKAKNLSFDL